MKKVLSLLVVVLFLISCGGNDSGATSSSEKMEAKKPAMKTVDIKSTLEKSFQENFLKRNIQGVTANVTIIQKLDEVEGFYFVQVDIDDQKNNRKAKQFVISDGTRILPDVINLKDGSSLMKDLTFKHENYNVDVSGLTLLAGNKASKNVIIKVSDFECPFCQRANDDLKKQLAGKSDYALYMMHLPLQIHKQAVLRAKVLEAGLLMGKNFSNELYHVKMTDADLIEDFAKKSGDAAKFKTLLQSPEVLATIKRQEKQANELGVSSTPVLFINGKKINGFNPALVSQAIKDFK